MAVFCTRDSQSRELATNVISGRPPSHVAVAASVSAGTSSCSSVGKLASSRPRRTVDSSGNQRTISSRTAPAGVTSPLTWGNCESRARRAVPPPSGVRATATIVAGR